MAFRPPGQSERLKAIGSLEGLPQNLKKAFDPGSDFESIPSPRPGDWLSEHKETGQTFEDFRKERWNRPDSTRNRIYLQPFGEFEKETSPPLDRLADYAKVFFAMDAKILG